MPAAYTAPIPQLGHPTRAPKEEIRSSLALRARVSWNAAQLDAALADGADPSASKALALRAEQLADPKHRTRVARLIHRLLRIAERGGPARIPITGAPFRPDRVERSRPQLMELAGRLETLDSPPVKGLAMANLLVEDGSAVLYTHGSSDPVRPAVDAVLAALQT